MNEISRQKTEVSNQLPLPDGAATLLWWRKFRLYGKVALILPVKIGS